MADELTKKERTDMIRRAQVIGISELPEFLGVQRATVHAWIYRGKRVETADWSTKLPEPDYPSINGHNAWRRLTIVKWAARTGRLPDWLKAEAAPYIPKPKAKASA